MESMSQNKKVMKVTQITTKIAFATEGFQINLEVVECSTTDWSFVHLNVVLSLPISDTISSRKVMRIKKKNQLGDYKLIQYQIQTVRMKKMRLARYLLYLWVQTEGEDFNSDKLLNMVGRTVNYSLINWLIVYILTERYDEKETSIMCLKESHSW